MHGFFTGSVIPACPLYLKALGSAGRERSTSVRFRNMCKINAVQISQQQLLPSLVKTMGASPTDLKIGLQEVPGMGFGLIALEDATPGEVLLSVPLTTAFVDQV